MYNGIGLQTARGSGTNGYVQRNLSNIISKKRKIEYQNEKDRLKEKASFMNKPLNNDIAEHQRKREIENKCLEYEERLKERGLKEDEIAIRLKNYRERIQEELQIKKSKKEEKFYEFFKELDAEKAKEKKLEELRKQEEERKIKEEMAKQEVEKQNKAKFDEIMLKLQRMEAEDKEKKKRSVSRWVPFKCFEKQICTFSNRTAVESNQSNQPLSLHRIAHPIHRAVQATRVHQTATRAVPVRPTATRIAIRTAVEAAPIRTREPKHDFWRQERPVIWANTPRRPTRESTERTTEKPIVSTTERLVAERRANPTTWKKSKEKESQEAEARRERRSREEMTRRTVRTETARERIAWEKTARERIVWEKIAWEMIAREKTAWKRAARRRINRRKIAPEKIARRRTGTRRREAKTDEDRIATRECVRLAENEEDVRWAGRRKIAPEKIARRRIGTRTPEAKTEKDQTATRESVRSAKTEEDARLAENEEDARPAMNGEDVRPAKNDEGVRSARSEEGVRSAKRSPEADSDPAAKRARPAVRRHRRHRRAEADREVWTRTRSEDRTAANDDTDDRRATRAADERRRPISTREREETVERPPLVKHFKRINFVLCLLFWACPLFLSSFSAVSSPFVLSSSFPELVSCFVYIIQLVYSSISPFLSA